MIALNQRHGSPLSLLPISPGWGSTAPCVCFKAFAQNPVNSTLGCYRNLCSHRPVLLSGTSRGSWICRGGVGELLPVNPRDNIDPCHAGTSKAAQKWNRSSFADVSFSAQFCRGIASSHISLGGSICWEGPGLLGFCCSLALSAAFQVLLNSLRLFSRLGKTGMVVCPNTPHVRLSLQPACCCIGARTLSPEEGLHQRLCIHRKNSRIIEWGGTVRET